MFGGVFECRVLRDVPAQIDLRISGVGATDAFCREAGGHRWQRQARVKRATCAGKADERVHTSTVTVAVRPLDDTPLVAAHFSVADLRITYTRGSGKGGQHRNKTDTACQVLHVPSGILVRCEDERSQPANREKALRELRRRLSEIAESEAATAVNLDRRRQIGGGARGDKRRTYRLQDNVVADDCSGKKAPLKRVLRGELELLWD